MKENNFKAIYKILSELEESMDNKEIKKDKIQAKALEISEERWMRIMGMLIDNGYIDNLRVKSYDNTLHILNLQDTRITLKGLEYLSENSVMKKIAKGALAIMDSVPGL